MTTAVSKPDSSKETRRIRMGVTGLRLATTGTIKDIPDIARTARAMIMPVRYRRPSR